jgi:hypothetical protein
MKKRTMILVIVAVVLVILFVPIPSGTYKDGGSKAYTALTYKIVEWKRFVGKYNNKYEKTSIYLFPDNFKFIDELWECEMANAKYPFYAIVLEIDEPYILIEPLSEEGERANNDPAYFNPSKLPKIDVKVGDYIKVVRTGSAITTNPAYIDVVYWEKVTEF